MNRIRTAGVPIWVTVFAGLMGAMGLIFGVAALIDPSSLSFTEADEALGQRWAGRQLGLGIVTTGAVILRSRPMHILALIAGVAREIGDLVAATTDGITTVPAIAAMLIGLAAVAHTTVTPTPEPGRGSALRHGGDRLSPQ